MIRRSAPPLGLLVAFCAALLLVAGCGEETSAKPSPEALETAESVAHTVTISAPYSATPESGGDEKAPVELDGRVFGAGATGVILAPMRPADQTAWFPFASQLASTGRFTVLTFDFRGFGASTGDKQFDRVDTDLASAYAYMRDTLGIGKIFLVGASMGGTASLVLSARVSVAGVVSISSPAQFENMDALAAVGGIAAPKLFVTSKDDVPAERSQEQLVAAAPGPKQQQVYDGDAHGTDLLEGSHAVDLEQRLLEFLVNN